jgi:hypothetical protein
VPGRSLSKHPDASVSGEETRSDRGYVMARRSAATTKPSPHPDRRHLRRLRDNRLASFGDGFAALAMTDRVRLGDGFAALAMTDRVRLGDGFAALAMTDRVRLGDGFAALAMTDRVRLGDGFAALAMQTRLQVAVL